MEFLTEQNTGITIVTAQKPQDSRDIGLVDLKRKVMDLVREKQTLLVLDLKEIDLLNSTEIGAIMGCLRLLQQEKGAMIACGIGLRLAETLFIIRMHEVIPMRLTREEAIADMRKYGRMNDAIRLMAQDNPSLETIRHWWDAIMRKRIADAATPGPAASRPPAAASPEETPAPSTLPAAPDASAQTAPIPEAIDPSARENLHDWMRALRVLREAKQLCASNSIPFAAEMSFKDFLARLAEKMAGQ